MNKRRSVYPSCFNIVKRQKRYCTDEECEFREECIGDELRRAKVKTEREKAELIFRRLTSMLDRGDMDDLEEFTKGGISVCCVILDIVNPYTGNRYTGDFTEMMENV